MNALEQKLAALRANPQPAPMRIAKAPPKRPPDMKHFYAKPDKENSVVQELRRIVNMPMRYIPSDEEVEALSAFYFQRRAFNDGWRLYRSQAESLLAYNEIGGAFLPLAVGGGKTLTSLLIANDAYKQGKEKVMLIVPPALATQLCDTDIKHWRPLTIFNMPVHRLHGLNKSQRKLLAKSNRKGLYIYTYSLLSSQDAYDMLSDISPELIICDEAHCVSKRSARTGRFTRYLHDKQPQLVALSGTMVQKSLMDYFELARSSLGKHNFLPNTSTLTTEWSKIIDSSATSLGDMRNDRQPNSGPLKYVIQWAQDNFPSEDFASSIKGFRNALQKRLVTTPGVVCSSGDGLPYSLYIHNRPIKDHASYPGWDKVQELVLKLENEWITPNGDEIDEAMHIFRWRYWIEGSGFYTERYWPDMEWLMACGKYQSEAHAKDVLERSQEYHAKHMQYMRDLRSWLGSHDIPNLDTPFLVGNAMHQSGAEKVGHNLYNSWKTWKDSDFEGRIERLKRAVRLCGFKVEEAIRWIMDLPKHEGGLVWYDNDEMGEWLHERLDEEGVEHLFCKAGKSYDEMLNNRELCKGKVIVLTINAHFQGKNLQFDRNQFFLQWPRPASRAEQSIGRQHRNGLEYDEVHVTTCLTTEFDRVLFGATLNDAAFVHQSQGNKQKLIYATYTQKPVIVPFEVLQEWHITDAELLGEADRKLLEKTFRD